MQMRILFLLSVLVVASSAPAFAQSLEKHGTVTEISGDRVIIEHDTTVAVTDGAKGRVFVTKRIGNQGRQDIIAGIFRVETVSGTLVVGRLTDRSRLVNVAKGQHVSFQTGGTSGGGGTLVVRSTPSGASVRFTSADGASSPPQNLGTTPVRESVSTGRYTVRVSKDGYGSEERTVRIRPGADRTVQIPLERRRGFLVVNPTPDTASIFIDGQLEGRNEIRDTLSAGEHTVRVEAPGYVTAKDTVQVTAARTRAIQPSLTRGRGTLKVRSEPQGAVFRLDGSKEGKTPVTKKVEAGRHPIQLKKGNYKVLKDTVQIRGGEGRTVDVELQRPLEVKLASAKGPVTSSKLKRVGDQLEIRYTLSGAETASDVELQFSHDGGKNYRALDRSTLHGDVGDDISPGQNKVVRWDVLQDFPNGIVGDSFRLRVQADAPVSGEFTVEVQSPPGEFGFGGGRIGWTNKNDSFFGASYTQLGYGVNVVSARGMAQWTLGGWLRYRTIIGLAYIDGVPAPVSGGIELGTGLHFGKSLYVGTDALYLQTLLGKGKVGLVLSLGVAL